MQYSYPILTKMSKMCNRENSLTTAAGKLGFLVSRGRRDVTGDREQSGEHVMGKPLTGGEMEVAGRRVSAGTAGKG